MGRGSRRRIREALGGGQDVGPGRVEEAGLHEGHAVGRESQGPCRGNGCDLATAARKGEDGRAAFAADTELDAARHRGRRRSEQVECSGRSGQELDRQDEDARSPHVGMLADRSRVVRHRSDGGPEPRRRGRSSYSGVGSGTSSFGMRGRRVPSHIGHATGEIREVRTYKTKIRSRPGARRGQEGGVQQTVQTGVKGRS